MRSQEEALNLTAAERRQRPIRCQVSQPDPDQGVCLAQDLTDQVVSKGGHGLVGRQGGQKVSQLGDGHVAEVADVLLAERDPARLLPDSVALAVGAGQHHHRAADILAAGEQKAQPGEQAETAPGVGALYLPAVQNVVSGLVGQLAERRVHIRFEASCQQVLKAGQHPGLGQYLTQRHVGTGHQFLHHQLELNPASLALEAHALGRVRRKVAGFEAFFGVAALATHQVVADHRCAGRTGDAAFARVEQAQVGQQLRLGADQRARVALPDDGLLDGDRWTDARDLIEGVFLGQCWQQADGLQVVPLTLLKDDVEDEAGFPRTADPGDDHQLPFGNADADVFQVVEPCALDHDVLHRSA